MLPAEVASIREIGDVDEPYWRAASTDGVHLALEDGETVLWTAPCRVSSAGAERWRLPDDTTLVVTDRRIAFLSTRFDTGGGWAGFGVAGLAVATAANLVSRRRAAARSAGLVVAGQVRHEWLTGLTLRTQKALIGVTDTYLDLSVATEAGQRLTLWGPSAVTGRLACWLAAVVARHRLGLPVAWNAEQSATLRRYVDDAAASPDAGGPDWRFPGDTTALIRAAAPIAARRAAGDPPQPGDRPMVAVCPFGAESPDTETRPAYDSAGALALEPGEQVLWRGRAAGVVVAAAIAARGREVFRTLWTTAGAAAELTLTGRRLVYAALPSEAGAPLAPGALRLSAARPGEAVIAGQVRHRNVPNILALDGAEYGAPGTYRVVASLIDPPAVVIRVHLFFPDRQSACDEEWIRAIATERLTELPGCAATAPEKWAALQRQAEQPAYAGGHYGPVAQLPLVRVLGSDRPR